MHHAGCESAKRGGPIGKKRSIHSRRLPSQMPRLAAATLKPPLKNLDGLAPVSGCQRRQV
jgi:hypothetical protein